MLLKGGDSEMTLGENIFSKLRHCPEHLDTCIMLHGPSDDTLVPGPGNPVQDDSADINSLIHHPAAKDKRCHGSGGLGAVDHKQHRELKTYCQLCRTVGAFDIHPVKQSAIAFDHHNLSVLCMTRKGCLKRFRTHEIGIKIIAGPAGCQMHPAGIDIVRAFLKRHDTSALLYKGRNQADRNHALSRTAA